MSPDFGLSIGGIIHTSNLVLLDACVAILELNHYTVSLNFWSAWWSDFCVDFRALGFVGCEDRSRHVYQGNHSRHPDGAFERPGARPGAQSWTDFSTFLVSMVVKFFVDFQVFGFPRFGDPFRPPSRGIINDTQAMFWNVCVKVLGPSRGDISLHFWSAWWPDFGPTSRVNRIYSPRAETMVGGLPRAFRLTSRDVTLALKKHHLGVNNDS